MKALMNCVGKQMDFKSSVLILILGSFVLGVFSTLFAEAVSYFSLPFQIRYFLSPFILLFVIFSIFLVFKKSSQLGPTKIKLTNFFLGIYTLLCLLNFIFVSGFSPLILAGSLSLQAALGVNVSTFFYPYIKNSKTHADLKPLIILNSEEGE